jgi:hypothetical protein
LLQKQIKPPFVPPVKDAEDVSMFYPELTQQKPLLDDNTPKLSAEHQQKFEEFGKMTIR